MSGRKLGGGRVLGSGKGLAPPRPPSSSSHNNRGPSPYAPSDSSSVSQCSNSQQSLSPPSSSPVPDFGPQDLVSRISIGAPSTGGAASARLVCPICDEEMVWPAPSGVQSLAKDKTANLITSHVFSSRSSN